MKIIEYKKNSHSKYLLRYHFVLCSKYRNKILKDEIFIERLKDQADKREIKLKTIEEKEKEQLRILKEKYETKE